MKFFVLIIALFHLTASEEDSDYKDIDVARFATHAYGTELLVLENTHYTEQKAYKFEDFFWTGSGDGSGDENVWTSDDPRTVYKTSTVISTVFIEVPSTETYKHPSKNCTSNCTSTPNGQISPTPTEEGRSDEENEIESSTAGQQFWLLTVLKGDGKDPVIVDLKHSLSNLYRTAFQRQQARHLGIIRQKRQTKFNKPINVFIHEVNKQKVDGENEIEVLYHVEMLGKPVDAHTAANDMKLVSDEEVIQELGFPFLIKAEPYVKPSEPQGLSKSKNTWFVIGVSIIGVLLLLLVFAFLLLGFTKRKRSADNVVGLENRRHIFERGVGYENKGLVPDDETLSESLPKRDTTPTYIHFGDQHGSSEVVRPQSSFSGASSSSSSLDISPLMSLGKKRKTTPRKPFRPRAAINKTVPVTTPNRRLPPEVLDSDSSTSRKDDSPECEINMDPGVMSPKSFLSMPSVKSFPRSAMPESLNRILEPMSVTNLDMPDGEDILPREDILRKYASETFIRHGSVGTMEDPGVIGPIVWKMHKRQGMDGGLSDSDLKPTNISRMRKRFHDLLDDTFSLFGNSRKTSPVNTPIDNRSRPIAIDVKSHSANESRMIDETSLRPRPKTTGTKQSPSSIPSYAWSSTAPSPFVRPLSAAPGITLRAKTVPDLGGILKQPRVNVEHVLADPKFQPTDPAITVIEAIKSELEKVSLPGCSTDLNK